MENPIQTQPSMTPVTEAVEPQMPKQKSNKTKALVYAVIALLILGTAGGAYYYFTKTPQTQKVLEETPPSLKVSTLQGKSVETGFYVYDATDVSKAPADAVLLTSPRGVNNFYSTTKMTAQDITDHVIPTQGLKLLFAFYSPGETGVQECANYWVYPQGPYQGTCTIADPTKFEVPAYRVFSIITNKDFQYYGLNKATTPADKLNFTLTSDSQSGWVLLPMPAEAKDGTTLTALLDANYKGRYDKVFVWTTNKFEEGAANFNPANGVLVWLRLIEKRAAPSIPQVSTPQVQMPVEPINPLINPLVNPLQENLNLNENLQLQEVPLVEPETLINPATDLQLQNVETLELQNLENVQLNNLQTDAAATESLEVTPDANLNLNTEMNTDLNSQLNTGSTSINSLNTQLNTNSLNNLQMQNLNNTLNLQEGNLMN